MKKYSTYVFHILIAIWLPAMVATSAFADNVVKLKVLVIATGNQTQDQGLAYIKPVLDEMGVPYDVLDASTRNLTAAMLSSSPRSNGCSAVETGCVGNYNGIILTDSFLIDLNSNPPISHLTPLEWDILHSYEKDFLVREVVLSGWPGTYWDPNPPYGVYLDYGLTVSSSGAGFIGQWTVPAANSKAVFEYVNQANPLPVTDFAFAAVPRNDGTGPRDGTIPSIVPLLATQNSEALVSIISYISPSETKPVREVMFSSITQASFLIHSQVLAYEFINWVTQGVFVGGRFVHMANHLDDLFLLNELWDPQLQGTNPLHTYRLNSFDILNAVAKQAAFRTAHPTAGKDFKLDFAFNGSGAVVNPTAKKLVANLSDDLVAAVVANKANFRFINHTFTHADMDKAPVRANANCDYPTLTNIKDIQAEIDNNRTVWKLLGLPEEKDNDRILVSGNHSGLKDRMCTDIPENHPGVNVQDDDVPFPKGANPLFLQAAAKEKVDYLASDSSQLNQNVEQFITEVDDGDKKADRLMLPRWPTNLFYNVTNPDLLVDEYNYIFYYRYVNAGQDPCVIPGAICAPRNYSEILAAEADTSLRHMLSFKKWPHYFHQTNLAKYDANGNTLQFDWLGSVYTEYEKLFTLPVKNLPYYLIGDITRDRLNAKSVTIDATWNRTTNQVAVSANTNVPVLQVTGLAGGEFYGGQFILGVKVEKKAKNYTVDQALSK